MIYDYMLLRQKMIEKRMNQTQLAANIGMKEATLSNKLSSITDFKQSEINLICRVLSIPQRKIDQYFFAIQV